MCTVQLWDKSSHLWCDCFAMCFSGHFCAITFTLVHVCACLRDKGRTHCLLPCCRWAASPDQQPCRPDRRWARLLLQPSLCSPSAAPDSAGRSPLEGGRMTDKQRKRGWVTEKAEGQRKMDILCYCSKRGKQREVTEYQKDCFPKMSSPFHLENILHVNRYTEGLTDPLTRPVRKVVFNCSIYMK